MDQPPPPAIAPGNEPIQYVSLVIILAVLIVLALEVRQAPKNWLWTVPMGMWIVHGLVFYVALFENRFGWIPFDISYTSWSSILRLHGYLTVLAIEITRWYLRRSRGQLL